MRITVRFRQVVFGLAVIACSALAGPAQATVLRVVVVETDNVSGYVAELKKGQQLMKRLGSSGQIRVWRARFAGQDTGTVIVSVEYPSLVALAQDDAKAAADAEWAAWLKGLDKYRKIVSDSTYDEL